MSEDQALALSWVYGTSHNILGNLVNLSDGYHERICYIAAHTAVIYDKHLKKQTFLQGHCNALSCLATTEDRGTIITADIGQESLLVLWNSKTGNPIKSIQQPHKYGICAMSISPNGKLLCTLGASDPDTGEQEISLWQMSTIFSETKPQPASSTLIPPGDPQLIVQFNMNNVSELITNGKRRVYFWSSQLPENTKFKYYSPPLRSKDFKQPVGDFVMSVFISGSTQALTATVDGDLVVWDEQGITAQMGTRATDRRAIKLMRIHNNPITFLATVGDYIISGGEDGFVRFFDPLLRLVAWFEDINAGPIVSVAFASSLPDRLVRSEAVENINRFMVPDFVVSTRESRVLSLRAEMFEEFNVAKRTGYALLDPLLTDVVDVCSNPSVPEFAILGSKGVLQRWDMVEHTCLVSRQFSHDHATCIVYARNGKFLVVGFGAGYLTVVNSEDLLDIHMARNTSSRITRVAVSSAGDSIAASDEGHYVLIYGCVPYKATMRWEFIGKTKTHHGSIIGLCYGESPAGRTRLFSLGEDARIVEYDLEQSSSQAGVVVAYYQDFGNTPAPTAFSFAPPLQYFRHHSTDTLLLMCDDQYKLRIYNPDSRKFVATFLGPTFGGPVRDLVMFRHAVSGNAFLAYSTGQRVVGAVAWPMDGDPAQTMGLIANPSFVSSITISYDGRKLLAAGTDGTLMMWGVNSPVLEASVTHSMARPNRWEEIVGDSATIDELRDYFYYAQIKQQNEDSAEPRHITGTVPVAMVPDLMRAVGFYPSNSDIENMESHIQFMASSRDLDEITALTFSDLLSLYFNHKPLFNVTAEDIRKAFELIGASQSHGRIMRESLVTLLKQAGETMTHEELSTVLNSLTGNPEVVQALPSTIDAKTFATDVLGFEDAIQPIS